MSAEDDDLVGTSGISRFIPAIVLISTIAGFVGLSWYAYNSGRQSMKEEDLLVVEADKTPIKEKPLDPGGMQFPNQDKTIFETFSSDQEPAKVERVLPTPEEPIVKSKVLDVTDNKVASDNLSEVKEDKISYNGVPVDETPVIEQMPDVNEEVVLKKPDIIKDDKIKAAEKPVSKRLEKIGPIKIQLGAFGSEKEAQDNWLKIQKKFPELSGKSPIVFKADVKGKIYHRLRVALHSKADAKSICKTLSAKGQACMVVNE